MRLRTLWGSGERVSDIVTVYFYPELLTALILYFLPIFVDAYFIGHLKSTMLYTISGVVDNFLSFFIKVAEGLSISIVVVGGFYNGKKEYQKVGQTFAHAFWLIAGFALLLCLGIYAGAYWILRWFHFSGSMLTYGVPFLRLRTVGIFLMFLYFACIGFLRALKNTKVPMMLFLLGSVIFVVADYVCIFGWGVIPGLGLQGSAYACIIQYACMLGGALWYLFYAQSMKKYRVSLYPGIFSFSKVGYLVATAAPIVLDKGIMASAYIWLASMISRLGPHWLTIFSIIKLMERLAFVPATAFAQVTTFLASNAAGRCDWYGVVGNTLKVLCLAACAVFLLLIAGVMWPELLIALIDRQGDVVYQTAKIFVALSGLVSFDLLQLILSAALRGIGKVQTVMLTRLVVIVCYFIPVSYVVTRYQFANNMLHFIIIYGAFFVGNALMSIVYMYYLKHIKRSYQIQK